MGKKVVKDKRFHSKLVNLVILFHYYSGKIHYNKGQDGVIASEYIDRFVLRYFMLGMHLGLFHHWPQNQPVLRKDL